MVSLSDTVAVGNYEITITQDARQAVIVGAKTDYSVLTGGKIGKDLVGSININGESVKVLEGETIDEVFEKIRDACDNVSINVFAADDEAVYGIGTTTPPTPPTEPSKTSNLDMAGYKSKPLEAKDPLIFVSREYGSKEKIEIYCDNPNFMQSC